MNLKQISESNSALLAGFIVSFVGFLASIITIMAYYNPTVEEKKSEIHRLENNLKLMTILLDSNNNKAIELLEKTYDDSKEIVELTRKISEYTLIDYTKVTLFSLCQSGECEDVLYPVHLYLDSVFIGDFNHKQDSLICKTGNYDIKLRFNNREHGFDYQGNVNIARCISGESVLYVAEKDDKSFFVDIMGLFEFHDRGRYFDESH